ncbi:hypothetical protein [Aestuariivirga sp.]|uniref:hypothetical protein n=1 Tax=Aestuariivirga sp. TaxID=2650926 RepID=UPI0035939D8A
MTDREMRFLKHIGKATTQIAAEHGIKLRMEESDSIRRFMAELLAARSLRLAQMEVECAEPLNGHPALSTIGGE